MKEIGVYIHIPFCKQKCSYCDFVSFAKYENMQKEYIEALKKEIQNWKEKNKDVIIKTIYIGGGTPSYIDSKYIVEILNLLCIVPNDRIDAEGKIKSKDISGSTIKDNVSITIEVNPGTVTEQKLQDYKNAGVNRLSIGLQSTQDNLLRQIGRIHNFDDFLSTYTLAKKLKYDNINVDLMIGLPNQTIQDIKESLETIINLKLKEDNTLSEDIEVKQAQLNSSNLQDYNLEISKMKGPKHISVYSLILEDNTPMQRLVDEGKLKLPDEELERQMYWYVKNFLELHGYKHYEISNFAMPGFESQHNMDCWNQKEYIGFGLAAHSYIDNKRFCNTSNLKEYIKKCENDEFEKNILIQEIQTKEDKMKEYMILGLRKLDGISIQRFENVFNENPIMLFRKELQKLNEEKLIKIDGDRIKLTNKGLDFANLVWEEFV